MCKTSINCSLVFIIIVIINNAFPTPGFLQIQKISSPTQEWKT